MKDYDLPVLYLIEQLKKLTACREAKHYFNTISPLQRTVENIGIEHSLYIVLGIAVLQSRSADNDAGVVLRLLHGGIIASEAGKRR
ncbi:MAG: hypothetical protein LBL86_10620 [Coriobacteriales bacterium]|jgi:hypothetical protein|nr:hypothetical protein [Coriobacteriales bacterium]